MTSPTYVRLKADHLAARKAKQADRAGLIGTLLAEIDNKKEHRDDAVSEEVVQGIVSKFIKNLTQNIEAVNKSLETSDRLTDLRDASIKELELVQSYQPQMMTDDEFQDAVFDACTAGDLTAKQVLVRLNTLHPGRFDKPTAFNRINGILKGIS